MHTQGLITDSDTIELLAWKPAEILLEPQAEDVRYSQGFLRSHLSSLFNSFGSHWLPLFHALGAEVTHFEVTPGLDFPDYLTRIIPVEVDGEIAVIGVDEPTERSLLEVVSPACSEMGADIVMEYLERRFISTLARSWNEPTSLNCYFITPDETRSAQVVGVVELTFIMSQIKCSFWLGIGPRAIGNLDKLWRARIVELANAQPGVVDNGKQIRVSVDIAELAVPPALLIDYLKTGTIIDLEVPVANVVNIRVDGRLWGQGKLVQFEGKFSVQISGLESVQPKLPSGTTHVQVEIANTFLDKDALCELSQVGAYLLTDTPIDSTANMLISGENVAQALIGQVDSRYALNVLPK